MKIVDTRGERCPKPIIETKKALKETAENEIFIVLTDNRTSFKNISRFLEDNGIPFSVSESDGVWKFEVNNKITHDVNTIPDEGYSEADTRVNTEGNYAVVIASEFLGSGDDILGKKLMESFFISLSCRERMPRVIAFYNSGVKLAVKGSPVADLLIEIGNRGVEIILCGTCTDHYKIDDKICAGKIVDMYLIIEKLSTAGVILRP
jgi:selenium metabolism protein YedF